jgi:hypothetical protein
MPPDMAEPPATSTTFAPKFGSVDGWTATPQEMIA